MPAGIYERSSETLEMLRNSIINARQSLTDDSRRIAGGRLKGRKGKSHSKSTKRRISDAKRGSRHTDETKQKISEASKRMWAGLSDEEKRQRLEPWHLAGRIANQLKDSSSLEEGFALGLSGLGLDYIRQYVVGSLLVDFYIPDINTLIEINGCYWHGCSDCGYGDNSDLRASIARIKYLQSQGYEAFIIWEHELT